MRTVWDVYAFDQAVWNAEDFVGRQDELGEVLDSVRTGNCVQIVGPRRIGKSSLLIHLTRQSTLARRLPDPSSNLLVYVDLQSMAEATEDAFWGAVITRTRARLLDMGAEGGVMTPDTPPLPPGTREATLWAAAAPSEAGARVSYTQALELLEDLKDVGFGRMTLLIDELEILGRVPTQGDLLQRLRALAGNGSWPMTFVTTSRHPIAALTHDGRLMASPFFNIFSQTVRLAAFSRPELESLVTLAERQGAEGLLAGWDPALSLAPHLDWVRELAGLHPFYSTVACRRLLRRMAEPTRQGMEPRALTAADRRAIEGDLSEDLGGQIDAALADRSPEEMAALSALAHGGGPPISSAVLKALEQDALITLDGPAPQVAARLVALHIAAPQAPPSPWPSRLRRGTAVAALLGALTCLVWLGNHLYGPLPRQSAALSLDEGHLSVQLAYPAEVRVGEPVSVDIYLTTEDGAPGEAQVALFSDDGGLEFVGGEVERRFEVPDGMAIHQIWPVKVEPRTVEDGRYALRIRATWRPDEGRPEVNDTAVTIEGRVLAGARVVVTSAATLLLTLLGFFGLNPRALTAWGIQLWQRLGRGSKEG